MSSEVSSNSEIAYITAAVPSRSELVASTAVVLDALRVKGDRIVVSRKYSDTGSRGEGAFILSFGVSAGYFESPCR